jgi:hypothetical protein
MNLSRTVRHFVLGTSVFLVSCKPGEKTGAAPAKAANSQIAPVADNFLVLPGDYAESTTMAELEARFGKENVRREMEPEPRVVLFPDDPTRRAYVTFYEKTFEHFAGISVTDAGSRWRGKHGVHVGMTFAKVRELNGKPFYYSGFDGQKQARAHGGWSPALDDDGGSLGKFDVSEGERLYFDIDLGVRDGLPQGEIPALPGDEHLSSDDPRFPNLGEVIVVTGIGASSSLDDEWE